MDAFDALFDGKDPSVRVLYNHLLERLHAIRPVTVSPKQTSIHLEKNSAFAGVHPRKAYINLKFRTDYVVDDPRIVRQEQLSARRYLHTVKLATPDDVDVQLMNWLKDAYALAK